MFVKWLKRLGLIVVIAAAVAGIYYMIKPQPVPVDIVTISRGEIETTIDEEGETRVKDVYRISAPISGKLERLTVQEGDKVAKGERLARMRPVDPPIRDRRTRRELEAATKTARAGVQLAQAEVAKTRTSRDFSKLDLERAQRLALSQTISARALQQAELDLAVKNAQILEAEANVERLEAEAEKPGLATDHVRAAEAYSALTEAQECVRKLYARWAELEAIQAPNEE